MILPHQRDCWGIELYTKIRWVNYRRGWSVYGSYFWPWFWNQRGGFCGHWRTGRQGQPIGSNCPSLGRRWPQRGKRGRKRDKATVAYFPSWSRHSSWWLTRNKMDKPSPPRSRPRPTSALCWVHRFKGTEESIRKRSKKIISERIGWQNLKFLLTNAVKRQHPVRHDCNDDRATNVTQAAECHLDDFSC